MDYELFAQWTTPEINIGFVSRLRKNAIVEVLEQLPLTKEDKAAGVISDKQVIFGHTSHKQVSRFQGRLIHYKDPQTGKELAFISNLADHSAHHLAQIYLKRWQIELLFKRIKGAYPLRYFLGETPNAIKIQIWCALIADLLIGLLQRIYQKKWPYTNLRAMIRLHCFSYVELHAFLINPIKALLAVKSQNDYELDLFSP